MFSDCQDDLCIFVCGTCKRYFTQLTAFTQHKKGNSCKKKSSNVALPKNSLVENHIAEETSEELETDDNADVGDGQDIADCSNEQFMNMEDCYFNSQKRKFPRKQDKTKIKRTVREMDSEGHPMFDEHAELESPLHATGNSETFSAAFLSMVPISSHAHVGTLFGGTSESVGGTCPHPVYVCKMCHAEFPNNQGRVYKCLHCRRGFFTEAELKQHIVRAKHDNLCEVCGKVFADKGKLKKHALSHVTERDFRCDIPGCTKAFKSAEDLRTHVKYVHATEKRFKCAQCQRAFSRPDKYKLHMLTHASPASSGFGSTRGEVSGGVQIPVTNTLALTRYDANPASTVPSQNGLSMFEDSRSYPHKNNFNRLSDNHLQPPSFHREAGDISTNKSPSVDDVTSSSLFVAACQNGKHTDRASDGGDCTKSHTSNGGFVQEYYEAKTSSFSSSTRTNGITSENVNNQIPNPSSMANSYAGSTHDVVYRPKERDPAVMTSPKSAYDNSEPPCNENEAPIHLVQSNLDHVPVSRNCERCKMRFLTSTEFFAHEERRADHVLRCEYCSGKFLSICELRFHQTDSHGLVVNAAPETSPDSKRVGVARQPQNHVCPDCGKAFTRADKLRRHAIIHSPDRPCIPCKCRESHGCMLTFYRKDSMKRHALTHTLEKPFKCDVCDKTFSRQDYVSKHISHVHKRIFKHRCTLCDYGTRESKRLRIHIRSRHEIDPDTLLPSLHTKTEATSFENLPVMTTAGITIPLEDMSPLEDMASPGETVSPGEMASPGDMTFPRDMAPPGDLTSSRKTVSPGDNASRRNLAFPEDSCSGTERKDSVENLGVTEADERPSEFVGDKTVENRSAAIQQYSLSENVERLERTDPTQFPVHGNVFMTGGNQHVDKKLDMRINQYKTPLNSLAVLDQQQPGAFSGLRDLKDSGTERNPSF